MRAVQWRRSLAGLWLVCGLLITCLLPTTQSLWIDESTTALYARQPTLGAFADRMESEVGSDSQMPLGNLYFWAGARVLGSSEISLRILSTLWIGIAVIILWRVGVHTGLPYLPVLFACNAFVWYYGGEVRPYAAQIALGAALLYAVVMVSSPSGEDTTRGLNALLLSGPLLCGMSMLGAIPVAVVLVVVAVTLRGRGWTPDLRAWLKISAAGVFTLALGSYFAWTLTQGKGAQTLGTWGVGVRNLMFAGYELLGFSGLGPGRDDLRQLGITGGARGALSGLPSSSALGIVILVSLYLWAGARLLRRLRRRSNHNARLMVVAAVVTVGSAAVLSGLSLVVAFPFWGRHLAPVLAFLLFIVAVAVDPRGGTGRAAHVLPVALCTTLLVSGLLVRFDPHHARDDYRSASRVARAAIGNGQEVWWSASALPAIYYGIRFCNAAEAARHSCVVSVENATDEDLEALAPPQLIVVSKPDLYDRTGAMQRYLATHHYVLLSQVTAFRLFVPG